MVVESCVQAHVEEELRMILALASAGRRREDHIVGLGGTRIGRWVRSMSYILLP